MRETEKLVKGEKKKKRDEIKKWERKKTNSESERRKDIIQARKR